MIRLLLIRIVRTISSEAAYAVWTGLSAVTLALWAGSSFNTWLAEAGLITILASLLLGGAGILAVGLRDLIRDLRHFCLRFHKTQ